MASQVISVPCRVSYAHLYEMYQGTQPNSKPKYMVSLLIDKQENADVIAKLKKAAQTVAIEKWGLKTVRAWKTEIFLNTFRNGDREADKKGEAYEGMTFFNATTKNKPKVFIKRRGKLIPCDDVKSGDYCVVSVNPYANESGGRKQVAWGLNNVLLVQQGDPLGSGGVASNPDDDFAQFEDSSYTPSAASSGVDDDDLGLDEDDDLGFEDDEEDDNEFDL